MSAASFDAPGAERVPGLGVVPGRGLSRLRVVPPAGERARPLRRPAGVLGRRYRDGVEGLRAHLRSARGAVPAAREDGHSIRNPAWLVDRMLRLGGSGAPGRGGAQALADAGRRGAVPAPGPSAVAGAGHRRGRRPAAGRGAGSGPHYRRAPAEAGDLHGERVSGDLGAGAVGGVGTLAGACHPCAPGGGVPGGRREPGLSGVGGGGDLPRPDRGAGCRSRRGERWNGPLWRWVRARARRRSTIRSWLPRARGCGQGATPKVTGKATWTLWPMSSHPGGSS